jgi:ATP-dependent DNA ligase
VGRNAWVKMRVNRAQEFVIGGYTLGGGHFDALIFGYWEGDRLMYAARTRSGFTPALREQLHQRFRGLETQERPFANLPEGRAGRNVRDPLPKAWPPTRHPGSTSPLQAGDNRAAVESMDRELCHGAVPEGTLQ